MSRRKLPERLDRLAAELAETMILRKQALHQCNAARVVNHGEFNAIGAHPCLCAHEGSVFTDDNARDFEQDGGT